MRRFGRAALLRRYSDPATDGRASPRVGWLRFDANGPVMISIRRVIDHDPRANTQGLIFHRDRLFESTGGYGTSSLRELDLYNGRVLRSIEFDSNTYLEGIALVQDQLIVLTYKQGVAFVYDPDNFRLTSEFSYEGQGWGLAYDGSAIFMTNGGETIRKRDPRTFEIIGAVTVADDHGPVEKCNDLEIVGQNIYANVHKSGLILKIDKVSGRVLESFDIGDELGLIAGRPADSLATLNGIAFHADRGTFFLSGKRWPRMFEVSIS
jgi:glutaminyl-peptide cyclotransferase